MSKLSPLQKVISFLILLISTQLVSSQTSDSIGNSYINEAQKQLFDRNYDEAISSLNLALDSYGVSNQLKTAEIYNFLAEAYVASNNLEKAIQYAKNALEISRLESVKNPFEEANAIENIGACLNESGKYEDAITKFEATLKIRQSNSQKNAYREAKTLRKLAKSSQMLGKYERSLDCLSSALVLLSDDIPRDIILKADIHEIFGQIHYDKAEFDLSMNAFEKAFELASTVYDEDNPYFIEIYNELALIPSRNKEFHVAKNYLRKALSLSVKNYGLDKHPSQIKIHFNLGTAYFDNGEREKALFHTKKSLEMGSKFMGENHILLHFPYSQLGRVYGDERGIPYVEKAINLLEKQQSRSDMIISFYHTYLVEIYTAIDDYPKALEYLNKILDVRLSFFGEKNMNTIESRILIAQTLLKLKEYDEALEHVNKALLYNNITSFNEAIHSESFKSISYLDNGLQITASSTKAQILLEKFKTNNNYEDLKLSNSFYKKAESLISTQRNTKRNYNDKIKFSSTIKSIYAKIIETKLLLNQFDQNSVVKDSIFYYSEKSKANVLREIAKNTNAKRLAHVNSNILNIEQNFDADIAKLTSKIVEEISNPQTDSSEVYTLEGKLFDINKRKDSLEKEIERQFPKYYNLKYEKQIVGIEEIQNELDDRTTFIEFLKKDTKLYVFIISKNAFNIEQLEIDNLDNLIESFNNELSKNNSENHIRLASSLYDLLIKPIKTHFVGNKLIIVPDETLWHLQFDLLVDTSKNEDKTKPAYLLYDYATSYTNSASMLFEDYEENKTKNVLDECIAFSYIEKDSTNTVNTYDLPGSRQELEELSKLFKGRYFNNIDANESNFKNYVHQYRLVHLALHAEIDNLNPEIIKIHFSNDNDKIEDNILYGHELYTVDIPADLVVLSACNTGNGKINKGEGILSLGNAFQYAGAESLVLSRWKISDETTPEIMKLFYTNLKNGMNKDLALQQAKIDYIKSADAFRSSPYYWGSFYILGNTDTIDIDNTSSLIYYAIGALLVLITLGFIIKRKK